MHLSETKKDERPIETRPADDAAVATPHEASDATQVSAVPVKVARPRGFAAMDPKRVSQIASKGGKAAHRAGTAHEFTSDEARAAGRKGGTAHGKRKPGGDASH